MLRRSIVSGIAVATLGVSLSLAPPAEALDPGDALSRQFHRELNAERAARGLAPLALDPSAAASSAGWAGSLHGAGSLRHSNSGRAEIIGMGASTGDITEAWMRSPSHRDLVVDPNMVGVGVGVSCDGAGRIWVVAQFAQAVHGQAAPRSAAAPRVTAGGSGSTCAHPGGTEDLVRRLYLAYLRRPVDPQGLATYSAAARAGQSPAAIGRSLAASTEFAVRHAGLDDRQFIVAAYREVLGRRPDPSGFAHWQEVLRHHGRAEVLHGFAESEELRQRTGWL